MADGRGRTVTDCTVVLFQIGRVVRAQSPSQPRVRIRLAASRSIRWMAGIDRGCSGFERAGTGSRRWPVLRLAPRVALKSEVRTMSLTIRTAMTGD